jgi:serine/threonine protein phosphatase PrpC
MRLRVGAASDVGRSRERNEDSYLVSHPLYVVADGMGGHRGGAEASSIAVEVLSRIADGEEDHQGLAEQIREANRTVFERQARDRSLAGMGTTVTAVLAEGDNVRLGHVGDSRAYLLRDGELRQLTEDHTLVHRMVQEGKISEEEAHVHPQRSIVTRALGVDQDIEVDEEVLEMRDGDRLLLCSDGLTSMMREESVQEILEAHADPQEAAEALVDAANRAGGLDNITVVVIDFVPGDGVELLAPPPAAETDGKTGEVAPERGGGEADVTGFIEPVQVDRGKRTRSRWRRPLVWTGVVVAVLVVGLAILGVWVNSQWYVGEQNGHVAVFRGIPTKVIGIDLSRTVRETTIPAADAEKLAPYRDLSDGITVGSEDAANTIVQSIRSDLERVAPPKKKQTGGGG